MAFDEFDVNKDGHIANGELKTVLKKLGQNHSEEELYEFIQACDVNKNGTIEFDEFCRYLVYLRRKVRIRTAYIANDLQHSYISLYTSLIGLPSFLHARTRVIPAHASYM